MQASTVKLAIERFKQANAEDPHQLLIDGVNRPRELVRAEQLAAWVFRLNPEPPVPVELAAFCQHLRRWEIPRAEFAAGRLGYLKWRKTLSKFHADTAASIMRDVGVDEDTISAVRRINLKQGLTTDANTTLMEDALCLSFLEHELTEFMNKHDSEKVILVLRKTWQKMSEAGQRAALDLDLPQHARQLVAAALAED
jgi:hypothetical protein